jgi:hypothetical protein
MENQFNHLVLEQKMENVEEKLKVLTERIETCNAASEEKIKSIETSFKELNEKFLVLKDEVKDGIHDFGVTVNNLIDSHAIQEERAASARFDTIETKIEFVSERGEERNDMMKQGFDEIKAAIKETDQRFWKVFYWISGGALAIFGYVVTFIIEHWDKVVIFMNVIEKLTGG